MGYYASEELEKANAGIIEMNNIDYSGEERQGFYIRPMMKRWWAVSLDIVKVVGDICARYGIRWFIEAGTLLGAVREHGFIPWDDDIDIVMLRQDYEKFVSIAQPELPKGWILSNTRNDIDHGEAALRVCNTGTLFIDMADIDRYHGWPYQAGIDIFVLDYMPDDPAEGDLQRALATIALDCFKLVKSKEMYSELTQDVAEMIT